MSADTTGHTLNGTARPRADLMGDAAARTLLRTPLHALHLAHGASMVPFAGYEMPVRFSGVMDEHMHTRRSAGLFDVSHMGQVLVRARSGNAEDAARALERLAPADIVGLPVNRQRYTMLTTEAGGILDDLMVTRLVDALLLVINAGAKAAVAAHLRHHLAGTCEVALLEQRALLALQGRSSEIVLGRFVRGLETMRFMEAAAMTIVDLPCTVTRSGYTGEDGFEIGMSAGHATAVAEALLRQPGVRPAGLGARDSLRLEAGLCLSGIDIDPRTTPVEAALEWSIPKPRRSGGARAGGFAGADAILRQLAGGVERRRVGIRAEGRAPLRAGTALFTDPALTQPAGRVTSGVFGPWVNGPVAMGYVASALTAPGTRLFAALRDRPVAARVAALPFVPHSYKR